MNGRLNGEWPLGLWLLPTKTHTAVRKNLVPPLHFFETRCDDVGGVPEAVATALFRVAQEALGNVEQHAQAGRVTLTLQRSGGMLRFEVIDDGRGFDADALLRSPRAGLGMTHMRERIESLGGRFQLASSAAGTWLAAVFPNAALAT